MPPKKFTNLSIPIDLKKEILQLIKKENEKAGYNKFKSAGHFIEFLIHYYKSKESDSNEQK